jgi:death-on-curing protein
VGTLTPQQILFIHFRLIQATGGGHGVRDVGALQAAAARPLATSAGVDLYPDPFAKAAALMESLIRNHPFIDGNKRTGVASAALLLLQYHYTISATQNQLYRFTTAMATGAISIKDAERWFRRHTSPL